MADRSKIEWTDSTWNPIRARNLTTGKVGWHCEHASPGCERCYSASFNARLGTGLPFKPGHRAEVETFLDPAMLTQPLRWTRPRMIFVCSMTDLFADFVPDEIIDQVFAVMALCPQHTFQVLTKRSARMRAWVQSRNEQGALAELLATLYVEHPETARTWPLTAERAMGVGQRDWPLPNVWLGVSAEDQRRADERVPDLLATPAAVRFVSAEPLLGSLDLWLYLDPLRQFRRRLDWIIVGGESGSKARPMHPDWVRSIHDQCAAASVPFFFKQWGEYQPDQIGPEDARSLTRPLGHVEFRRVGKKLAGRKLFGVEHNGMPQVAAAPLAGAA